MSDGFHPLSLWTSERAHPPLLLFKSLSTPKLSCFAPWGIGTSLPVELIDHLDEASSVVVLTIFYSFRAIFIFQNSQVILFTDWKDKKSCSEYLRSMEMLIFISRGFSEVTFQGQDRRSEKEQELHGQEPGPVHSLTESQRDLWSLLWPRSYWHCWAECVQVGLLLVTQSWLTLCDPMDCSSPGSSVHGILQARILE